MIGTKILREQHDAALAMADRLIDLVDHYEQPQPIYPIVMQLNRLLGLLRVHLAAEDVDLYSRLIASDDPKIARLAQTYVDEMGGLAANLEQFARYWSCSASIAGAFDEFRDGVHELMLALAVRIERENFYLYPVAEAEAGNRRDAAQSPFHQFAARFRQFVPDRANWGQFCRQCKKLLTISAIAGEACGSLQYFVGWRRFLRSPWRRHRLRRYSRSSSSSPRSSNPDPEATASQRSTSRPASWSA